MLSRTFLISQKTLTKVLTQENTQRDLSTQVKLKKQNTEEVGKSQTPTPSLLAFFPYENIFHLKCVDWSISLDYYDISI